MKIYALREWANDWSALAQAWIDHEAPIERAHSPIKDELLKRAALQPEEKVLDLGCGSGALALDAAKRVGPNGSVIAFDISEAFITRVEERAKDVPQVSPVQGDAQTFSLSEVKCDAVISLFGTMFFSDPQTAFTNIGNSLKEGGRIAFVTWAGPQHNPWFSVPGKALADALPEMPKPDPSAPGPMAFANKKMVTDLLSKAGFADVAAEEIDTHLTPIGAAADITAMMLAIGPFRGAVSQFAKPGAKGSAMDSIAKGMTEGYGAFAGEQDVRVPARVIFYTATR